ncbi:hypothetical protein [Nonomuraea rubra]|uniref:hypothetical protein n=1 Tax=Nonomuraea rubra TaxID=46180 RepID=UPI003400522D
MVISLVGIRLSSHWCRRAQVSTYLPGQTTVEDQANVKRGFDRRWTERFSVQRRE